jgi:putative transposase
MLRAREPRDGDTVEIAPQPKRALRATRPNHAWHLDLTTIPTRPGFWVPWVPFAIPQRWPFAWWVAFVLDHASRAVVGFAVYKTRPDSREMCVLLGRAIRAVGERPRHVITDKGREFFCARFKRWCRRRGIGVRFGAVGTHGSVVVIERFIRSVKQECLRRILVPLRMDEMRREISLYCGWYNEWRPHETLGGRTPLEVYCRLPPANEEPRWEPRARWPLGGRCGKARVRGKRGARLELRLSYVDRRRHLPVVAIRRAG